MGQDNSVPADAIYGQMPPVPENTNSWKYNYHFILQAGKIYRIESWELGVFTLKGGNCGYFTFEATKVVKGDSSPPKLVCQICDDTNKIVLSLGKNSTAGRLTVQDNPNGTTSVIYTQGGTPARRIPIPIRVNSPNEMISLTGTRDFQITGDGARLQYGGYGSVRVDGDLVGIEYEGYGKVTINGSVQGKTIHSGRNGCLVITGNCMGNLTQEFGGRIDVEGDVEGDILQMKDGVILVRKAHNGRLYQGGTGHVQIGHVQIVD